LHRVGDLFELNVKVWCQKVKTNSKTFKYGIGKAIPLQVWTAPEGSRRIKLPDFKTIGI
jgi:hypothetical protein